MQKDAKHATKQTKEGTGRATDENTDFHRWETSGNGERTPAFSAKSAVHLLRIPA